jgi:hypothetical protein
MSDYIAGLRTDLVDAAARHQRRGALARTTIAVRPRAWSRPALAAAVMTAACLAAVLVAVWAIGPPAPKPATPHIVLTTDVASVANDAVVSGGDLWVSDLNAGLVRVDPATGQVKAAVPLGGASRTLAASPDGLWAIADHKVGSSFVVHIDPRTGRVVSRHAVAWSKWSVLAADAAGLWLPSDDPGATMERVRAPDRAPTAFLRRKNADEVAVLATPTTLWAVTDQGTLVEADNVTGRVIHTFPRAVTRNHGNGASGFPDHGLAADARGVWVIDQDREVVARYVGGRIVQRIRTGGYTGEAVALSHGSLWVSVTDPLKRRYKVVRFDSASGRRTGSVDVSFHVPKALVPTPQGLWVVASDGTATLIR